MYISCEVYSEVRRRFGLDFQPRKSRNAWRALRTRAVRSAFLVLRCLISGARSGLHLCFRHGFVRLPRTYAMMQR